MAVDHGDAIAIVNGRWSLTFIQLDNLAQQTASQLSEHGVSYGDRVVVASGNSIEHVAALLALLRLKAVVCPINYRLPRSQLNEMITTSGAKQQLLLSPDDVRVESLEPIGLCKLTGAEHPLSESYSFDLDQAGTILFTSGTSGSGKGVMHSVSAHYYSALGSNEVLPLSAGDRWLLSLPLFHVGGLSIVFRCMIAGATVVIPISGEGVVESIEQGATHCSLVPTQLYRLLDDDRFSTLDISRLKLVLLGGAPVPRKLLESAANANLPVRSTYGLTEMASQVATAQSASSGAKLLPYRKLKVASDGELLVAGETLMTGYVNGDSIDLPVDRDGYFATGDIGSLDSDGTLRILGRKDNMFQSAGENIHAEKIERVFSNLFGSIEQVVVVDVPDSEYGTRPVAFVFPAPEESLPTDWFADAQKLLSKLEIPVACYELPDSDQLKPDRKRLRNLAIEIAPPN
jgi:O-succinylbenzoic acid--CoA ligase